MCASRWRRISAKPLVDTSIRHYAVADFPSLTAAALHYLAQMNAQPRRAIFAVAGKVGSDEIRITNLPWVISIAGTRKDLSLSSLDVINDFAGMSMAIPLLTAQDVETIGDLSPVNGQERDVAHDGCRWSGKPGSVSALTCFAMAGNCAANRRRCMSALRRARMRKSKSCGI